MAPEHYSIKLEAFNITCHQLTLPPRWWSQFQLACEQDQTLFARGAYTKSDNVPARK